MARTNRRSPITRSAYAIRPPPQRDEVFGTHRPPPGCCSSWKSSHPGPPVPPMCRLPKKAPEFRAFCEGFPRRPKILSFRLVSRADQALVSGRSFRMSGFLLSRPDRRARRPSPLAISQHTFRRSLPGWLFCRASEQWPLRIRGLRPLRRRLGPALLPHGFAVGTTPLHSAFKLFKLIDDVIGKLLNVREGVTARNQTKIELIPNS